VRGFFFVCGQIFVWGLGLGNTKFLMWWWSSINQGEPSNPTHPLNIKSYKLCQMRLVIDFGFDHEYDAFCYS
jgi:hypothetical protein